MTALKITNGKGIHLAFDNNLTLSVQIGGGNYCDNYNEEIGYEHNKALPRSRTAEIAVWSPSGDMVKIGTDTVAGYVPIDTVLRLIPILQALPSNITDREISETMADFNPTDWAMELSA